MSAPQHVTARPGRAAYVSPPWRPDPWMADRPGEVVGHAQPSGPAMGNQGPDQGYVWKLTGRFEDRLVLGDGEHVADVMAGCVAVALHRASLFGRAPVVHDVAVALTVFGFLNAVAPDVVAWRRELFSEVSHPHNYLKARTIADLVPEATLRLPHGAVSHTFVQDLRGSLGRRGAGRRESH